MSVVKLCTYSRSFYPYVWGQKARVIMAGYIVIEDGKILRRSFKECHYLNDYPAESEAVTEGIKWVIGNMEDLRHMNLQVFFCGAGRKELKDMVDDGRFMGIDESHGIKLRNDYGFIGNPKMLNLFNKVEFGTASRILIHDGEEDDPENSEIFDMYSVINTYFTLLYGDDINYGHTVIEDVEEDGIVKKIMVGLPEIRWRNGCPGTSWS